MKTDVKLRVRNFKRVKIIPASAKDPGPPPIKPIPFPKVWFSLGLVIAVLLIMMGADKMQQSVRNTKNDKQLIGMVEQHKSLQTEFAKQKQIIFDLNGRMALSKSLMKLLPEGDIGKLKGQINVKAICALAKNVNDLLRYEGADDRLHEQLGKLTAPEDVASGKVAPVKDDSCDPGLNAPENLLVLRGNLDSQIVLDNARIQIYSRRIDALFNSIVKYETNFELKLFEGSKESSSGTPKKPVNSSSSSSSSPSSSSPSSSSPSSSSPSSSSPSSSSPSSSSPSSSSPSSSSPSSSSPEGIFESLSNFFFADEGIGAYCFKVFLGLLFALLIYGVAIFILCFTQNSYFGDKTVFDVVEEVKKWIGTGLSGAGRALIPLAFVAPVIAGAALATQTGTSDAIRTEASGSRAPKKTSGVEQKVDEHKIDVKLRLVDTSGKEIGENGIEFDVRPKVEVQPVPPVVLVGGGACVAGGQPCSTNLAEVGKLTGALESLTTALKLPAPAPAPVPVICQSEHRNTLAGPVPQGYLDLLRRLKELEGKVGAAVKAESMTNSGDSPHKKPNP